MQNDGQKFTPSQCQDKYLSILLGYYQKALIFQPVFLVECPAFPARQQFEQPFHPLLNREYRQDSQLVDLNP